MCRWQHRRRCPRRPHRRCWCRPRLLGLRLHALHPPSRRRRGHVDLLLSIMPCDHAELSPRASTRPHVRRARPQLHVPSPRGRQRVWRAPPPSWLYTPGQLLKYASALLLLQVRSATSSCPPMFDRIYIERTTSERIRRDGPRRIAPNENRTNGPFVRCSVTCSVLFGERGGENPTLVVPLMMMMMMMMCP